MRQGNDDDELGGGAASVMLNALLERLDRVLGETKGIVNGMPLFAVEAKLVERLRAGIPGVRFTAQDIRVWAAEISS